MPADNRTPLKLRFAKSALVPCSGYETYVLPDGETSGVRAIKGATPAPEQCTFCVSSAINVSFGACEVRFVVENTGNAVASLKKPLMVGIVDRTFTGFDGPINPASGWALTQDGTVLGRVQDGRVGGVTNPQLVADAANKYGSQCIVVAIDAKRSNAGHWEVFTHGGRKPTGLDAVEWAKKMQSLGAGEILLTSMDKDGTRSGFDLALTRSVSDAVSIPVIASGGVGGLQDLADGITEGHADAVLAASIFHYQHHSVQEAKQFMAAQGIPVRLA